MSYKISGLSWEWLLSNLFYSSTLPICLKILGIFIARHYLEEFNSIKGLLLKPKNDFFFYFFFFCWKKMSWLVSEGQITAMIFLYFSGHLNTWTFRQQKKISVYLRCQFGSHHVIPGSCALNYLYSCLLNCPWTLKRKSCLSQTD